MHHSKRPWYRSKFKIGALAAILVVGGVAAAVHYMHSRKERAAFLMMSPDMIPSHPELVRYALPRGKAAYKAHCASCHGADMKGAPFKGIPDLTDDDFLYGSGRIGEIERVIMYGIRSGNSKGWDLASMPAFSRKNPYPRYKVTTLTPRDLDDIVSYIYSFQHPPKTDAEKKAVGRGELIYRGYEKGVCWDCHANDARGDSAIGAPDLIDNKWLYGDGSRKWIYDSIAFGLDGYCPAWEGRLAPETIRSIAVYLHSILKKPEPASSKPAVKTASAGEKS
jgi:cytochrome c oxidase cbb3-type subunit 3